MLDGKIIKVNKNFFDFMGYMLEEIKGQYYCIFVVEEECNVFVYVQFWQKLGCGEYDQCFYCCIIKFGYEVWIQVIYNFIIDVMGCFFKIVKYVCDVMQQQLQVVDFFGQIIVINKVCVVIEFDVNGNILYVNNNFLCVVGYLLFEIVGKYYVMFVEFVECVLV